LHRATPANSNFRAFSAGGARALISKIDDSKLMQEIAGSFMKGEARKAVEHAQQYGFTAVPFDADEGEDGKPGLGPECFVSFIGGNRSFPTAGPIDDRRHRMKGLEKGDVGLFRGKDDGQQFHMNGIGSFLSTYPGKKLRMQIVQKAQEAAQGGARAVALAEGGGGGNGGQAGANGQQKPTGQKPVYKNESAAFFEVDDAGTKSVNKAHEISLPDGTAVIVRDGQVYLGGDPAKGHTFEKVMLADGSPSLNVNARKA
jgi:phage gp45-like